MPHSKLVQCLAALMLLYAFCRQLFALFAASLRGEDPDLGLPTTFPAENYSERPSARASPFCDDDRHTLWDDEFSANYGSWNGRTLRAMDWRPVPVIGAQIPRRARSCNVKEKAKLERAKARAFGIPASASPKTQLLASSLRLQFSPIVDDLVRGASTPPLTSPTLSSASTSPPHTPPLPLLDSHLLQDGRKESNVHDGRGFVFGGNTYFDLVSLTDFASDKEVVKESEARVLLQSDPAIDDQTDVVESIPLSSMAPGDSDIEKASRRRSLDLVNAASRNRKRRSAHRPLLLPGLISTGSMTTTPMDYNGFALRTLILPGHVAERDETRRSSMVGPSPDPCMV